MRATPANSCRAHKRSELPRIEMNATTITTQQARASPRNERNCVQSCHQKVFFDVVAHELRERLTTHRLKYCEADGANEIET